MPNTFRYADIHCHPNLKAFGHSFDRHPNGRSDMWQPVPPNWYTLQVYRKTGITKFSQTDFTTMVEAQARIAIVSLYPYEKGFFTHPWIAPPLAALLATWGTEIGYRRVRHLQQHTSYYEDLEREYRFMCQSEKERMVHGKQAKWVLTRNWTEIQNALLQDDTIAVVFSIEGAHVFDTGLEEYGVTNDETTIMAHIEAVRNWTYAPLFIGLAHNFNNDLCGHAPSLQRLGKLVNQSKNMDTGIAPLGYKVIEALLDRCAGRRPIYIDLKHMSLRSRLDFYQLLQTRYAGEPVPLIASHVSVTGRSLDGKITACGALSLFNNTALNFFDEEIVLIARSSGLLALQMDIAVHTNKKDLDNYIAQHPHYSPLEISSRIIWSQLQHIAEVCDRAGLAAWHVSAIGSDFDGSIKPFPGILRATNLQALAKELEMLAAAYLVTAPLKLAVNRNADPAEIIERFMYGNTASFLQTFYQ